MKTKLIIPCLDLKEGRVVKGLKFEDIKDAGDPVELARRYNAEGADELALLDIGGWEKGRLLDLVRTIADDLSIPFCVGGAVKTVEDMRDRINAGASKVSLCSAALLKPELLSEMAEAFGSKSIVLAIDAKRISAQGEQLRWNAFSGGGRVDSGLDAVEWARKGVELGAGEIMLNSIDADGTGAGYDLELCAAVASSVSVPVIASGGAGSMEQIAEVLKKTGVTAALVASMLHFEKTTVPEIKKYLGSHGVSVKL